MLQLPQQGILLANTLLGRGRLFTVKGYVHQGNQSETRFSVVVHYQI